MKTSIAIYPGSFDPVTNGHLDLIERGEKMFDLLIVAVLRNAEKAPLFSVAERVEMLREVTRQWSGVEVEVFDGLLVDYARKRHAGVILRGIRAISDYEYELQMALMNRKLEPRLETVFMLPGETYSYLSSKLVREIAQLGGPLQGLVPPVVESSIGQQSTRAHHFQSEKSAKLFSPISQRIYESVGQFYESDVTPMKADVDNLGLVGARRIPA